MFEPQWDYKKVIVFGSIFLFYDIYIKETNMKLFGKYEKSELENLIFDKNLSYREIGRHYGVSDTYIKKICGKMGISLKKRAIFPDGWKPHNAGTLKTKHCENCNKDFLSTYVYSKYCSKECESKHKKNAKYKHYLDNQSEYCNVKQGMRFVKPHILKEQNECCDICGNENKWNDKSIVFVLDHINGDASNNRRENLRLICPNCDSQLDTYKSKNKNSARKERYLMNYKK